MYETVVNICDVCKEIFAGGDAPKDRFSKTKTKEYQIPIYSNGEANNGLYGYTDFFRVNVPSITVSARGTIGYTAIREEPFVPIVRLITLVPNHDVVNIRYLYYAMQNYNFSDTGTSIPQLTVPTLKQYNFPLPEMNKQKHIVEELDEVSNLIVNRERLFQLLNELSQSRFIELFGDPIDNPMNLPVKKLKELSVLITNGNTPKGGSENYVDEGILFLRSQNVWRNRIELDDVAYIDETIHQSMKKSSVKKKDILLTKTGRINTENSSLGRAALYLGDDDSANINGHVYLIRLNESVLPEYVVEILTSEAYRKYIRKVCVGGIDKRQINLNQVEDFPIIMPEPKLQRQFVDFIEQVEKSKIIVKEQLTELATLKKSLMQKYFG